MIPPAHPIRIACSAALLTLAGLPYAHAEPPSGEAPGTALFQWDNDKVVDTDRHYTNGVRIAYTYDAPEEPWLKLGNWWAEPAQFPAGVALRIGWVLGQDMYTPEDVNAEVPDPNDRPYAGWSYVGLSVQSEHEHIQDTFEADIGVIGPSSKAAQTQNAFHRLINVSESRGWKHQIHNEIGVRLTRERKLRGTPFYTVNGLEADVLGHGRLQLGNVQTGAAAGATVRLGHNLEQDFGPTFGGVTLPQRRADQPFYGIFAGIEAHAVVWDIFLDGNSFRDSPNVDKKPLVLETRAGFTGYWPVKWQNVRGVRVSASLVHRTREFKTQDQDDRYGSLQVSVDF